MIRKIVALIVCLGIAPDCMGAWSASTVFEVRTGGSDTNGGGYAGGGTDWSQQDSPQYSVADGVTNGTTTITSATANFGTDVVGNFIWVNGGTGAVAGLWFQIISRTNATTIVVDRSTGLTAGTGTSLNIGGGFASPGNAAGRIYSALGLPGMQVFVKSGTYTLTNTTVNTSGGPVQSQVSGSVALPIVWQGYVTTHGDMGTPQPVISAGAQTSVIVVGSNASTIGTSFNNIAVDCNSGATTTGFSDNARRHMYYLDTGKNCTNNAFKLTGGISIGIKLLATGCSTQPAFVLSSPCIGCEASGGTVTGFNFPGASLGCVGCLSHDNSGATSDGFATVQAPLDRCTAYNNGRDGFRDTSSEPESFISNSIAEKNGGFGFSAGGATRAITLINDSAGSDNTSGGFDPNLVSAYQINCHSYTSSAFTNPAAGDFSLNNTINKGGSIRGTGYPGVTPSGTSTGYLDPGAIQHRDLFPSSWAN